MNLTFRIGGNNKDSLGVFEAVITQEEFDTKEDIDARINLVKELYFKHRVLGSNDPMQIKKALHTKVKQP